MSDAEHIAVVEKNSREEVRVSLDEFAGVQVVDVRIFADFKTGPLAVRGPTKKGVTLKVEKLSALIQALLTAQAEAVRRGLVVGD